MTRAIVHRTPGLLDIQAITVMGLSAKPNSTSPIGQFGTGLKYAIATLVRLGATPRFFIGRDEYEFRTRPMKFRGEAVEGQERIIMRRRRFGLTGWHSVELPFTTNYGKFWKPWMAFRELEANTRDEGGWTAVAQQEGLVWEMHDGSVALRTESLGEEGTTTIVVDAPEYVEAWEKRDEIFLPTADRTIFAERPGIMQAFHGQSPHAYYRTLRALDLNKPSCVTWCLLAETGLTEDRFISEFWLRWYAGLTIVQSDDETFIEHVLTAGEEFWEHELTFPDHVAPSPAFRAVVRRRPRGMMASAAGYVGRHTPYDYAARPAWDVHGRPWGVDEAGEAVSDVHGTTIMVRPDKIKPDVWRQLMAVALARINRPDDEIPEEPSDSQQAAYRALLDGWSNDSPPDLDTVWSALRMASRTHPVDEPSADVVAMAEQDASCAEEDCPGHVASEADAKICGRCGTHIDSLRPDPDDDMPF